MQVVRAVGIHHVVERVVERAQVRVDLVEHRGRAGSRASRRPRPPGGTARCAATRRSMSAVDGQCHRQVRLAGAGRSETPNVIAFFADRVDVALLVARRARTDRLASMREHDVVEHLADVLRLLERAEDGVDRAGPDLVTALDELDELRRRRSAPPVRAARLPRESGGCRAGGWSSRAAREASRGRRRRHAGQLGRDVVGHSRGLPGPPD